MHGTYVSTISHTPLTEEETPHDIKSYISFAGYVLAAIAGWGIFWVSVVLSVLWLFWGYPGLWPIIGFVVYATSAAIGALLVYLAR